jgi:hypothetical protein
MTEIFSPTPKRDANLFKISIGQVRQHRDDRWSLGAGFGRDLICSCLCQDASCLG